MLGQHVLELIWNDCVSLPDDRISTRFAELFGRILPVRVAPLVAGGACDRPLVMSDCLELVADLQLGDVLVEELPVELCYDTLVVLLPRAQRNLGALLGGAVAESLILALSLGDVPMERENEALHALAQAAVRRATELDSAGAALDLDGFLQGLGRVLHRHWLADAEFPTQPDFLTRPAMVAHLSRIDAGFVLPDMSFFGSRLLDVSGEPLAMEEWISRTMLMLRAYLGAPERGFEPLKQDIRARFNFH